MLPDHTAGRTPRATGNEPLAQKRAACHVCGGHPDGYDARADAPVCRHCATLRADGGPSTHPCAACGTPTPLSQLVEEDGVAVCPNCSGGLDVLPDGGTNLPAGVTGQERYFEDQQPDEDPEEFERTAADVVDRVEAAVTAYRGCQPATAEDLIDAAQDALDDLEREVSKA